VFDVIAAQIEVRIVGSLDFYAYRDTVKCVKSLYMAATYKSHAYAATYISEYTLWGICGESRTPPYEQADCPNP